MTTLPRYPVFIPSKSRSDCALTPDVLDRLGVPYRLVVEESQFDDYAARWGGHRILTLDPAYQEGYDTCDSHGGEFSRGSGPARNFIWDTAKAEGHPWHWIMDDNISGFARTQHNQRIYVGDGTIFHAMETFATRYSNVAMAGPQYWMMVPSREQMPPFIVNSRIYSCNLIRTDAPFRWRGRYNEDTILSLDMLKAGWCTVLFYAFLQYKITTQQMPGGNTEAFYAQKGTLPKSQMLVRLHPDVAKLSWKYGRWHHHVNYKAFDHLRLIPNETPPDEPAPVYRLTRKPKPAKQKQP